MTDLIARIGEARIGDAARRGELADLPGQGKLMGWEYGDRADGHDQIIGRILRNAGFVPEEVRVEREMAALKAAGRLDERRRRKLRLLRLRQALCRMRRGR